MLDQEQQNDAIKVAPDLHQVIFENDKLRVLKVTVKPGATAAMHWHPEARTHSEIMKATNYSPLQ